MRILYIHAKNFFYKPISKAKISRVEAADNVGMEFDDVLVVFTSVEKGDFERRREILTNFIEDMKRHVERINVRKIVLYPYAHLSDNLEEPNRAVRLLKMIDSKIKQEMPGITYARAPFGWYKEFKIYCLGHPLSELSRRF
jgi:threonyl-tRNA synthetase